MRAFCVMRNSALLQVHGMSHVQMENYQMQLCTYSIFVLSKKQFKSLTVGFAIDHYL